MILYPQARFVSSYLPSGTTSFRLGSRKLFDYGGNGQNLNADSLSIFIPPPGYVFGQCDQDGAEARIVAYDAPPGRYRKLFELGIKVHTYVGLIIFQKYLTHTDKKIDYTMIELEDLLQMPNMKAILAEIKNHPSFYDIAKRIVHGSSYLLGPRTMQRTILKFSRGVIRLSQSDCRIYQSIFFGLFPEIRAWHKMIEVEARKTGELRNFFNHPRVCAQIFTDSYIRELISWKPQSTVAEITHRCAVDVDKYIQAHDKPWFLVNNKHDSLVAASPEADAGEMIHCLAAYMQQDLVNPEGVKFTMKTETKVGKNLAFKS